MVDQEFFSVKKTVHPLLQSCPSETRFVRIERKIRASRAEGDKERKLSKNSLLFWIRDPSGNFTCMSVLAFHAICGEYNDKK